MAATPRKSARRVLGDLGVNKSITPSKIQSPRIAKKQVSLEVRTPTMTLTPGRKRSIQEVEGAASGGEARSGTMRLFRALEQATVKYRPSDKEVITILSDDESSSEGAIDDENVEPSDENNQGQGLAQEASQSTPKNSQSSQIDLTPEDGEMSEVGELTTLPSSPPPQQEIVSVRHNFPITATFDFYSADKLQRAERLRLGLQIALFKVQTNQIDVPLSRLQIVPRKHIPSLSSTNVRHAPILGSKIASQPTQSQNRPRLLPAPLLVPTAYSARQITLPHIPSSPPISTSTAAHMDIDEEVKPATPEAAGQSPKQLSSPSASHKKVVKDGVAGTVLTGSAEKGRAAHGSFNKLKET